MGVLGYRSILATIFVAIPALVMPLPALANVVFVSGEVSGNWSADTVLVTDSIYVSPGDTLIIEPGVDVLFSQASYFRVHDGAVLHAVGTEQDSIKFMPLNSGFNTLGIIFDNASDESIIEYCYFTRALYSAITLYGCDMIIRNCLLEDNHGYSFSGGISVLDSSEAVIENNVIRDNSATGQGGAIYCNASSPLIRGNLIDNNSVGPGALGGGISCANHSNPLIMNNIFSNNGVYPQSGFPATQGQGGAIYCSNLSSPIIAGNTFINNMVDRGGAAGQNGGGAIFVFAASPIIANNLFVGNSAPGDNGGALYLFIYNGTLLNNIFVNNSAQDYGGAVYIDLSDPSVTNCIFRGNGALNGPVFYLTRSSTVIVNYSDIEGGWDGRGNIDVDSLFRDSLSNDYRLMSTACGDLLDSPCIDAGDPTLLDSLLDCTFGLGTEISDMGAYGGGDSVFVGMGGSESVKPEDYRLIQNYPNPFNAQTLIRYELPEQARVLLDIHDILGRRVATLADGMQSAGKHQAVWDASAFAAGVYYARLRAAALDVAIKMTLLK